MSLEASAECFSMNSILYAKISDTVGAFHIVQKIHLPLRWDHRGISAAFEPIYHSRQQWQL